MAERLCPICGAELPEYVDAVDEFDDVPPEADDDDYDDEDVDLPFVEDDGA